MSKTSKTIPDYLHEYKGHPDLTLALAHSSAGGENYERLEFLGDRVLSLVIADILYERFPDETEGDMAKRHTALVQGVTLARVARDLGLAQFISMSSAERDAGGTDNDNILADVMESVIAFLYRELGLTEVKRLIALHFGALIDEMHAPPQDPKTALQEWAQARSLGLPKYELIGQSGPDHAPEFEIEVTIKGYPSARAIGASKREAQKRAALELFERLENE